MPIFVITYWVYVVLGAVAFGIEVWALVDAVRRTTKSFEHAEKRTKTFWVAILAVAAAIGYLSIPSVYLLGFRLGFGLPLLFGLAAVLPAAIYHADVKPEVRRFSGRGRSGSGW